jgi:tetratricopeptide (TPR) repeat protein
LAACGIIFFYDSILILVASVLALLLGIAQLLITLNLWTDFSYKENRLRFKIDRDAKNHRTLFLSARQYGERGMWGLAVIHLRRAVVRKSRNSSYQMALAVAYTNIKRYDLAEKTLNEAEASGADALEIQRLRKRLDALTR